MKESIKWIKNNERQKCDSCGAWVYEGEDIAIITKPTWGESITACEYCGWDCEDCDND